MHEFIQSSSLVEFTLILFFDLFLCYFAKICCLVLNLGYHVVAFVFTLSSVQFRVDWNSFVSFFLASSTDVEHLFGQVQDLTFIERLLFIHDEFNELISELKCLLLIVLVVIVADDIFFLGFFLGDQEYFADEFLIQLFDDMQIWVLTELYAHL